MESRDCLSVSLESFETAGRHMADIHDALIELWGSDNWAVEILLTEYRETVIEHYKALERLRPFGIHSHEEALREIYREEKRAATN